MDVSIVIVNYNNFNLLKTCLESLNTHTQHILYEIIVVDNNSTEGCIEDLLKAFSNVILIKNEQNMGFAAANNIGAKIASGKYLLILNNDVVFIENAIQKVFQLAEQQKEELVIGCKLLNKDRTIQPSAVDFDNLANMIGESFFLYKIFPKSKTLNRFYYNYLNINAVTEVDFVKGAFLFCSSKIFHNLLGFDERFFFFSEEADLCFRFKKGGGRVLYYPHTSIIHIGGGGIDKAIWFTYKNLYLSKIKFYQKHYDGAKFFVLVTIYYLGILIRIPLYFSSGIFLFNKKFLLIAYYYSKQIFLYPKNIYKGRYVQK